MKTKIEKMLVDIKYNLARAIAAEEESVSNHGIVTRPLEQAFHEIEMAILEQSQCSYHEDHPSCMECGKDLPGFDFSKKEFPYCKECK